MTLCELSSRARAFSVEALIGVKRRRSDDVQETKTDVPEETPSQSDAELQKQQLKRNLKVELCSRDLWRKFHSLGTEMIITKAGRRMFPTVKVRLSGLDPAASYIVFLDIVPVDDKRYRYVYHSSQWMVAGSGDPPLPHNLYVHPDSPATGQLWMAQGVVAFDKLKLTNNRKPLVRGQVSLHSMHKYLPRVHILQTSDLDTPPEQQATVERALTYTFPETSFTTVTAYQNQQITRLKIASNPFAKGFREASRTRDSLDDSRHQRPPSFPSPPLVSTSKYCSGDLFGLHPDLSRLPPSSLFLHGRPPLDPYYPTPPTLLHPGHGMFSCQPLTTPVKFVVPPMLTDPSRRLCMDTARRRFYPEDWSAKPMADALLRRLSPDVHQHSNLLGADSLADSSLRFCADTSRRRFSLEDVFAKPISNSLTSRLSPNLHQANKRLATDYLVNHSNRFCMDSVREQFEDGSLKCPLIRRLSPKEHQTNKLRDVTDVNDDSPELTKHTADTLVQRPSPTRHQPHKPATSQCVDGTSERPRVHQRVPTDAVATDSKDSIKGMQDSRKKSTVTTLTSTSDVSQFKTAPLDLSKLK